MNATFRRKLRVLHDLQETLDAEEYLTDILGVTNYDDSREWITFACPLPFGLHSHGDSTPSAAIHQEHLGFNCWVCGSGDVIWLTQSVFDVSSDEALRMLKGIARDRRDESASEFLSSIQKLWADEEPSITIPNPSPRVVDQWSKVFPYFSGRGVSEDVQVRMRTGFDIRNRDQIPQRPDGDWYDIPRVVIPHFFRGQLVGWLKRRVSDDLPRSVVKYKNSPGFPKPYTLYNYDNVDAYKPVIVVESTLSALYMMSAGFDNVVATFGGTVRDEQIELLRGFDEVVVFFDFDWAGSQGMRSVVRRLNRFTKTWGVVGDVELKKDPANYTASELQELIHGRVPAALIPKEEG